MTIGADDSVDEALKTMTEHGVRRLPVIDGHQLVGMVSQADIARNLPRGPRRRPRRGHLLGATQLRGFAPMTQLTGRKVAFLVATEGIEEVELTEPWQTVVDGGGEPALLSTEAGKVQAFDHLDKADTFEVDTVVADASVDDYDALVLPGGVANPDNLRTDADAVSFVRDFVASGKPVAAICHAPWTLVEADVVVGRQLTSWPSLQTDIRNAGGNWVDREVVVDGNLITSRKPDDLPAFNRELVKLLSDGS